MKNFKKEGQSALKLSSLFIENNKEIGMNYETWELAESEEMEKQFGEVESLGDFLRWAFDYYTSYWLRHTLLDEIFEAAHKHDISEKEIDSYITEEIWNDLHTEDGNSEASIWFSSLIGEENSMYFYKYGQRHAWDSVINGLTDVIVEFTDFDEDEANDHANEGTFNRVDTFDTIEVDTTEAKEILKSHIPDYWD
jgi:hypothetical protein